MRIHAHVFLTLGFSLKSGVSETNKQTNKQKDQCIKDSLNEFLSMKKIMQLFIGERFPTFFFLSLCMSLNI